MSLLNCALKLTAGGVSVIPCDREGKDPIGELLPRGEWKPFQDHIASEAMVRSWFADRRTTALGLVCGKVSGRLEVLDHDTKEHWLAWCELVENFAPGLLTRLVLVQTQSGNHHAYYRCPLVEGSQKLARGEQDGKVKTLIETKGDGGYALTWPTEGYTVLQGDLCDIPAITPLERKALFDAARVFNEMPESEHRIPHVSIAGVNGNRPGDDFNRRGDPLPILESAGWVKVKHRGDAVLLRRPRKKKGISATWNYIPRRFYNFSTNGDPFEDGTAYSAFAVYAILGHGGDFSAAARSLVTQGYGNNGNTGKKATPKMVRLEEAEGEANVCQWLDDYVDFSEKWSPRAYPGYHVACGLFILSTVAARRVRIPLGPSQFTPLYQGLVGRSSRWAKTTTARNALATLKAAGLDFLRLPDECTPQYLVSHLALRVPSDYDDLPPDRQEEIKKRLAFHGKGGWFYEEFGAKLDQIANRDGYMAEFRHLLRRVYDSSEKLTYGSIGRGLDEVVKPYVSLLVNVTPTDLKVTSKRGAANWSDGLFARFAFVTAPLRSTNRDRWPVDEEFAVPQSIWQPLQAWHERLGIPEINVCDKLDDDGNPTGRQEVEVEPLEPNVVKPKPEVYEAYYRYYDALLDMTDAPEWQSWDLDSNYTRFHEKALRIAALFASFDGSEYVTLSHWSKAQRITESWREDLHRLVDQVNEPDESEAEEMEERIYLKLCELSKSGTVTARSIGQRIRGLSSAEVNTILGQLEQAGAVKRSQAGRTWHWSPVVQV